jgi:hypothetical protein
VPGARALLLLTALGLTACRGAPSPTTPPQSTAKEATALKRRATLRFEIAGRPFPLPLVAGTVAGHPTMMLVDSGSNVHVLSGWLARKLSLPLTPSGDRGADHVGQAITAYRIDRPSIAIEGWGPLDATTTLATEFPEVLEKLGIGALVSPQQLDEEGDATLMDLAKGELRSAWWDAASADLSMSGTELVRADRTRTCNDDDGTLKGLAFVVPATIDKHEAQLLVDTGAVRSDVFVTSALGKELEARGAADIEPTYTVKGKLSSQRLKGARLVAGAFATTVDVELLPGAPDRSCPRDGVLAVDVLRSCTLLFGRTRMLGRCAGATR